MNCLNCKYHYMKDINYDETLPEYVIICGLTNEYIGYPDDEHIINCNYYEEEI